MVVRGVLALVLSLEASGSVLAQDLGPIVESMYRNAIVKIDVSSNTPVFDGSKNRCLSEGTGFLVNKTHVVTANHVLDIPRECGSPVIIVKSRPKFRLQLAAKRIGEQDDVALLEVPTIEKLCSLLLSSQIAFASPGFRYFMPAGITEPEPVKATIGEKDGPYGPLISLSGANAFPGDSGGPVVHNFTVVGILKARDERYANLNFMITVDRVAALLTKFNVLADGSACNPAMYVTAQYPSWTIPAPTTPAPDRPGLQKPSLLPRPEIAVLNIAPHDNLPASFASGAMQQLSTLIVARGSEIYTEANEIVPNLGIDPTPDLGPILGSSGIQGSSRDNSSNNGSQPSVDTSRNNSEIRGGGRLIGDIISGLGSNSDVTRQMDSTNQNMGRPLDRVIPPLASRKFEGYTLPGFDGLLATTIGNFVVLDLKRSPAEGRIRDVERFRTTANDMLKDFYWQEVMKSIPSSIDK